jgi:hypothetical protein
MSTLISIFASMCFLTSIARSEIITLNEKFLFCRKNSSEITKETFCDLFPNNCLCYNTFIKKNREYNILKEESKFNVFFSEEEKLFHTFCQKVSQISIQGSPSNCFNDLVCTFRYENRDNLGFLTKDGLIREDTHTIQCNEKIYYFKTLSNIHQLKKFKKHVELITQIEYEMNKKLVKRSVEACLYTTFSIAKEISKQLELELQKGIPNLTVLIVLGVFFFLFLISFFSLFFYFKLPKKNVNINLECVAEAAYLQNRNID